MMYGSSDMECNRQNFLSFWTIFCPFTPLTTQKNQNFEKMKTTPGDIIILHKCTKNDNHICKVPEILSTTDKIFCYFGPFFALLPPTPLTTQKIKILKKWKKCLEILLFYTSVS